MRGLTSRNRIHMYSTDGIVNDEADLPDLVDTLTGLLTEEMRDEGYVPMLDLTPRIFTWYKSGNFQVKVELFGMYVGKRKSREYEGVSGWKMYRKPSTEVSR